MLIIPTYLDVSIVILDYWHNRGSLPRILHSFKNSLVFQTTQLFFHPCLYSIGYQPCPSKPGLYCFIHGYFHLEVLQATHFLTDSNFVSSSFNFKEASSSHKGNMVLESNLTFLNQFCPSSIGTLPFTTSRGRRFFVPSWDTSTTVVPYGFTSSPVYVLSLIELSFNPWSWPTSLNLLKLITEHEAPVSTSMSTFFFCL